MGEKQVWYQWAPLQNLKLRFIHMKMSLIFTLFPSASSLRGQITWKRLLNLVLLWNTSFTSVLMRLQLLIAWGFLLSTADRIKQLKRQRNQTVHSHPGETPPVCLMRAPRQTQWHGRPWRRTSCPPPPDLIQQQEKRMTWRKLPLGLHIRRKGQKVVLQAKSVFGK